MADRMPRWVLVVLAAHTRPQGIVDQRRADFRVAVGGDGDADAGTADQNPLLRPAVADGLGHGKAEIRVIHGVFGIGPEVQNLMAHITKLLLQFAFKGKACMIAGNRDGFGAHGGSPLLLGSAFVRRQ